MGIRGGQIENDYDVLAVDLGVERLTPTLVYQFSNGVILSTTVTALDGTCGIGFNDASKPTTTLSPLTYPQFIGFIFAHNSIYVTNAIQGGKTLVLWIGRSS